MDATQPDGAPYDVIIIGGGICGAAAARALTRHGYRILLLDRGDFAAGATAASARLVQGGLQYLESGRARQLHESLHARERLLRSRPHLVRPHPFLLPVYHAERRSPALLRAELAVYDVLTPRKVGPWSREFSPRAVQRMEPSLATDGLRAAFRFHDGLVDLPERLCLEYLSEARAGGADLRNYASVDFILGSEGGSRASGVDYHDVLTGRRHSAAARLVLNASGPWVDDVLQATGRAMRPRLRPVRATHVVLDLEGRGPAHALLARGRRGRPPTVVVPWLGLHIVGVAESEPGDAGPGPARPAPHEIDGLLDAAARLLPGVGVDRSRALYAYTGLQPWGEPGKRGGAARRVIDHAEDGMPGLLSIVGGTLSTAEAMADRTVKVVRGVIGGAPRRSRPRALPMRAPGHVSFLPPETMAHLRGRYGQRSADVAAYAGQDASLAAPISPQHPDIGAQVVYAVEHEQARTVGDVLLRRTPVGRTRGLGRAAAPRVAAILQSRMGWSDAERAQAVRDYELELHRTLTVLQARGAPGGGVAADDPPAARTADVHAADVEDRPA